MSPFKIKNLLAATTALFIVLATTNPASALDWKDPEWVDLGCPKKLSGDWIAITDSPYAGMKISFHHNAATLSSKNSTQIAHTFTQTPNLTGGQYLILQRVPEAQGTFPKFLKIRPHMAIQGISKEKKYALCKIKIFLFDSKQKADRMSYLSWDIYSTIESIEVPNGN